MRSMRSQLGAVDEVSEQGYLTPATAGLEYIKLDDESEILTNVSELVMEAEKAANDRFTSA